MDAGSPELLLPAWFRFSGLRVDCSTDPIHDIELRVKVGGSRAYCWGSKVRIRFFFGGGVGVSLQHVSEVCYAWYLWLRF